MTTSAAIRARWATLAERVDRGAIVLARVLAELDEADGPRTSSWDRGAPGSNPDWCPVHDCVIDQRCRVLMCRGVPTAAASDPTGDAATEQAPHTAARREIAKHVSAIERALDRIADECAKHPPPPGPLEVERLRRIAAGENVDAEAGLCRVCVSLGDSSSTVDNRYRSHRLCRKCGEVRNILRGVKAIANPDEVLPKLVRLMRDRGHANPDNKDIGDAAGILPDQVVHTELRAPKLRRKAGWHTADDYRLGENVETTP